MKVLFTGSPITLKQKQLLRRLFDEVEAEFENLNRDEASRLIDTIIHQLTIHKQNFNRVKTDG